MLGDGPALGLTPELALAASVATALTLPPLVALGESPPRSDAVAAAVVVVRAERVVLAQLDTLGEPLAVNEARSGVALWRAVERVLGEPCAVGEPCPVGDADASAERVQLALTLGERDMLAQPEDEPDVRGVSDREAVGEAVAVNVARALAEIVFDSEPLSVPPPPVPDGVPLAASVARPVREMPGLAVAPPEAAGEALEDAHGETDGDARALRVGRPGDGRIDMRGDMVSCAVGERVDNAEPLDAAEGLRTPAAVRESDGDGVAEPECAGERLACTDALALALGDARDDTHAEAEKLAEGVALALFVRVAIGEPLGATLSEARGDADAEGEAEGEGVADGEPVALGDALEREETVAGADVAAGVALAAGVAEAPADSVLTMVSLGEPDCDAVEHALEQPEPEGTALALGSALAEPLDNGDRDAAADAQLLGDALGEEVAETLVLPLADCTSLPDAAALALPSRVADAAPLSDTSALAVGDPDSLADAALVTDELGEGVESRDDEGDSRDESVLVALECADDESVAKTVTVAERGADRDAETEGVADTLRRAENDAEAEGVADCDVQPLRDAVAHADSDMLTRGERDAEPLTLGDGVAPAEREAEPETPGDADADEDGAGDPLRAGERDTEPLWLGDGEPRDETESDADVDTERELDGERVADPLPLTDRVTPVERDSEFVTRGDFDTNGDGVSDALRAGVRDTETL